MLPAPLKTGIGSFADSARLGWAITREAGASVLTYELYPLGVLRQPLPTVASPWVRSTAGKVPVLFIHGVFHNTAAFAWLKQKLAWAGWRNFDEINLYATFRPIPKNAEKVAERVAELRRRFGVEQIDIVAHSMGGIIARYFVQQLGGDGVVRHLITLGTPHQGTEWSRFSVLPHLRELSPRSETLELLNSNPLPKKTQAVSVSGAMDILMRPRSCALWTGARNFHLKQVGHAGLLFSRRVADILIAHLGENIHPDVIDSVA